MLPKFNMFVIMVRIVLVGFFPCDNGRSCNMHPFGCDNSLVLNREDYGVGMLLRLRMMVPNELSCYTINSDGSDGCRICFVAHESAAGENGRRLDGCTVHITDVFTCDDANRLMCRLYHHNHGYGYARVVDN